MFTLADLEALPHITADDSAFCWWLCDAQFVDTAVPPLRAHDLVFDSVEIDAITALRVRLATHGLSN